MQINAETAIIKARSTLVLHHPFFASLVLRLRLFEDRSCRDAWSDGELLGYNPDYISILPKEKLLGLLVHVVMHPACNHHKRRGKRHPTTWNKACDYAINEIVLEAGFTLPDGYLYDSKYVNREAEAIYAEIAKGEAALFEESEEQAENENEADDEQTVESEASGGAGEEGTGEEGDEQQGGGDDSEEGGVTENDPGDGAPPAGEVRDAKAAGVGGGASTETNWDEALASAAIATEGCGSLPAGIQRVLQQRLYPKLSWQELLHQFLCENTKSDYSWLMPNRRHLHQGLYLPSLNNREIGEIVIAIDSSGSISEKLLSQFSCEISELLERFPVNIKVLYCDTNIVGEEHFNQADLPLKLQIKGGGGTDYRPVFNQLEQSDPPICLIYFTDLNCSYFPSKIPHYPVLWISPEKHQRKLAFGEQITMEAV